jgi:hypothetical protein
MIDLLSNEYREAIAGITDRNYFTTSNDISKRLMKLRIKGSAASVLECLRYLIGQSYTKSNRTKSYCQPTIREICEFTGQGRQSVQNGLEYLVEEKIVIKQPNGNKSFYYGINPDPWRLECFIGENDMSNSSGSKDWLDVETKNSRKGKTGKEILSYKDKDLDSWNNSDFCYYMRVVAEEKTKKMPGRNLNIMLSTFSGHVRNMRFKQVMEYLYTFTGGKYSNLLMKAYVDWFASNIITTLPLNKKMNVSFFAVESCVKRFLSSYGINEAMPQSQIDEILSDYKVNHKDKVAPKKKAVSGNSSEKKKEMESIYKVGPRRLLSKYGVVLAANFLSGKMSAKEVEGKLGSVLNDIKKENNRTLLSEIIETTCNNSPYKPSMGFLNWKEMFASPFSVVADDLRQKQFISEDVSESYPYLFLLKESK